MIFNQDQDLAEIALEVRDIARTVGRWLKTGSVFPHAPRATATRGIDRTDWFRMDGNFYDACLDSRDYRPGRKRRQTAIELLLVRALASIRKQLS